MKKELRAYLETLGGLTRSATEKEAWAFYRSLKGEQKKRAKQILSLIHI